MMLGSKALDDSYINDGGSGRGGGGVGEIELQGVEDGREIVVHKGWEEGGSRYRESSKVSGAGRYWVKGVVLLFQIF